MLTVEVEEALVKQVRLFADLSPEAIRAIAAVMHVRRYRRSMLIFSAGEPVEAMAFVLRGAVRVYRDTADGHEQTLQVLRAGDPINLAGVVAGSGYPASAVTVADSDIGLIRCADFTVLLRSHGDLAWALIGELAARLRWAQGRIFDFALRTASGRVASALLQLAQRDGKQLPDGSYLLDVPLTHRELGQMAGISRETTTRMLQQLRKSDAIRWTEDGYLVVDPHAIAPWLDPAANP